jgi:NAD(P)-dependent dehydrogenase (short-subunit alcohol dehydrogenase family)
MSPRLTGRIAIVTGASSGIGRAIALAYAQEGASVMCADLNVTSGQGEQSKPTHEVILGLGHGEKAAFMKTDVTSEAEIRALILQTVKLFGRLDM